MQLYVNYSVIIIIINYLYDTFYRLFNYKIHLTNNLTQRFK